jgi:hypothetical protein
LEKSSVPVVAGVAVTEPVPETVIELDGESTDRVPAVTTFTPVKVAVLLMFTEIGVTTVVS